MAYNNYVKDSNTELYFTSFLEILENLACRYRSNDSGCSSADRQLLAGLSKKEGQDFECKGNQMPVILFSTELLNIPYDHLLIQDKSIC
jgi:hypothetical protein